MLAADVTPRPQLMATYYEKLARIFWVSENPLFHAYAWYKFFALTMTQNKALGEEDRRNMASAAVLSALAIPIYSSGPGAGTFGSGSAMPGGLEVDAERDKKSKLATLLKHASLPSRDALLAELVSKGALKLVRPEVSALFRALQVDFSPLTLVTRVQPVLARLRADLAGPTLSPTGSLGGASGGVASNTLAQYVPNLERLVVFRLLQQLTAVYTTVKIDFFRGLIGGMSLSFLDVQKLIARAVKARQLTVRMDLRAGVMRLGADALETAAMRRQLTELAVRLQAVMDSMTPTAGGAAAAAAETKARERVDRRSTLFEAALRDMADAPGRAQARREEIEMRKDTEDRRRMIMARKVSERGGRVESIWAYGRRVHPLTRALARCSGGLPVCSTQCHLHNKRTLAILFTLRCLKGGRTLLSHLIDLGDTTHLALLLRPYPMRACRARPPYPLLTPDSILPLSHPISAPFPFSPRKWSASWRTTRRGALRRRRGCWKRSAGARRMPRARSWRARARTT